MSRPYRFSIRMLFFYAVLPALISALMISRKSDSEFRRIASIAISSDGEQLAVSLQQGYYNHGKQPDQFQRSISLLNTADLRTKEIVYRDDVYRKESVPLNFFWNSQSRLLHPQDHLLFIDGRQESLMCHDLRTGRTREWATFPDGYICSFDSSKNGRHIALHGESPVPLPPGDQVTIEGTTFIVNDDDDELIEITDSMVGLTFPLCISSNLGVDESETIRCEFSEQGKSDYDDLREFSESKADEKTSEVADSNEDRFPRTITIRGTKLLQTASPMEAYGNKMLNLDVKYRKREYSHPFNWRMGIVQSRDPDVDYDVATICEAESVIYDHNLGNAVEHTRNSTANHRWKTDNLDASTSIEGNVRLVNLVKDKVIIELKQRTRWGTQFMVPTRTNETSCLKLSQDGTIVAVAEKSLIQIIKTGDLDFEYSRRNFGQQLLTYGYVEARAKLPQKLIMTSEASVTALEFTPDNKYLIAGNNRGYVTKYRLADGEIVAQVKAPGRVTGLHQRHVVLMIGVWFLAAFAIFIKQQLTNEIIELNDDVDEFLPTVADNV